ncbi:hypothetical protein J4558_06155 [Leptolyngbya sp. 15MV]|nr:hypothetical protein J4558_06155 [Leptolyngbya sp. 15MV]
MSTATSITVRVPLKIRRSPGRKTVITQVPAVGIDASVSTRADPALVKALARAFRYQRLLDEGRYASISEMAATEDIDRGYLGRLLRLAILAPDIVEAVLNGRHSNDIDLALLMEPTPMNWSDQRKMLSPPTGPNLESTGAASSADQGWAGPFDPSSPAAPGGGMTGALPRAATASTGVLGRYQGP